MNSQIIQHQNLSWLQPLTTFDNPCIGKMSVKFTFFEKEAVALSLLHTSEIFVDDELSLTLLVCPWGLIWIVIIIFIFILASPLSTRCWPDIPNCLVLYDPSVLPFFAVVRAVRHVQGAGTVSISFQFGGYIPQGRVFTFILPIVLYLFCNLSDCFLICDSIVLCPPLFIWPINRRVPPFYQLQALDPGLDWTVRLSLGCPSRTAGPSLANNLVFSPRLFRQPLDCVLFLSSEHRLEHNSFPFFIDRKKPLPNSCGLLFH